MIGELNIVSEWIPEQMVPGTVFVLENAGEVGEKGLITRKQVAGLLPVICGSDKCSTQFFIHESEVVVRKPF